jgi:hypothetical protein
MPTTHRRIAVTEDAELAAALRSAAAVLGDDLKPARLVRELALRGAQALIDERRQHDEAIERLIVWSISGMPGGDRELLERRDEIWGLGR